MKFATRKKGHPLPAAFKEAVQMLTFEVGFFALLGVGLMAFGCEKPKPVGSTGSSKGASKEGGGAAGVGLASCKTFCAKFLGCQQNGPKGEELEAAVTGCVAQCKNTPAPPNPEGKILKALRKCVAENSECGEFLACASKAFKKLSADLDPPKEDPNVIYKVPLAGAPRVGAKHGLVTVVGFLDARCGYCSRGHKVTRELLKKYGDKLRIVFRDFPLGRPSDISFKAAEAAYAVFEKKGVKAYWEFQKKVFDAGDLDEARLGAFAEEVGMDSVSLAQALKKGTYKKQVEQNIKIGRRFGVEGTPTFFVNGKKFPGFLPQPSFEKLYAAELEEAQKLLKKGVAREALYKEMTKDGEEKVKYLKKGQSPQEPKELDSDTAFKIPVKPIHPQKGSKDAPVTVVVFSDFACPFSRRLNSTLDGLVKSYPKEVRLVFRNLPLPMHPRAYDAAEASLIVFATKGDKAFWLFHDKLFQNQDDFSPAALEKMVQEVGVDLKTYRKARLAHKYEPQVKADLALAQSFSVGGSPQMFINGKPLGGAVSLAQLKEVVEAELKAAQARIKKGVAPAKVYETIMKKASEKPVFE